MVYFLGHTRCSERDATSVSIKRIERMVLDQFLIGEAY